jgi:uncharacterized protein (TIGR02569 family)
LDRLGDDACVGAQPPKHVLVQFGVDRDPEPLAGGEGLAWRAGAVVLKPTTDEEEANWVAELLTGMPASGFRVQRPVRGRDGGWVAGGWTAWEWLEGAHDLTSRWPEVLELCQLFHQTLPPRPRPAFLDHRTNPWSVGDRAAWGEVPLEITHPLFTRPVSRLMAGLRPVALPSQVIHGDFPGNVLFAAGQVPAVIDFTPYYRPAAFAAAVVVVDAIAWYGAGAALMAEATRMPECEQMIARAAIYRLVTADRASRGRARSFAEAQIAAHQPLLAMLGI